MERLCDLYFELSNEDRLRILRQLQDEPMKVTMLSRFLEITNQECSRHLSRLQEANLATKDTEGQYHLTPYGELTLVQLRGQLFTSRYREYFSTHTLNNLPYEFVSRLGELENSEFIDDVMVSVHLIEETLRNAEEYILNFNIPYIASAFPMIREVIESGIECRWIRSKDIELPEQMKNLREQEITDNVVLEAMRKGTYQDKVVEGNDLVLYLSEKGVAIIAFPLKNGDFDFHGFKSTDPEAHKWCRDIFEYYWSKS